jgi:hypothetical protein
MTPHGQAVGVCVYQRWLLGAENKGAGQERRPCESRSGANILTPSRDRSYYPHTAVYRPLKSRLRWHPGIGRPVAAANGAVIDPNTDPLFPPLEL